MKIEEYAFGRIVIDGRAYTSDLIIYTDQVDDSWWRNQSHRIDAEDISEVIDDRPELLIIGTGQNGMMDVPQETLSALAEKGITVLVEKTAEAVRLYNQAVAEDRKVIAALHLTC